jgi:hypothetical protein
MNSMEHKIELEIYKFGEYFGYQCSCGGIISIWLDRTEGGGHLYNEESDDDEK